MTLAIDLLLTVLSIAVFVPAAVLFTEVMAARKRPIPSGLAEADDSASPRTVVLMPAHDEANGIGETIDSLRPQLGAADRLLVVADNCSDATARIARAHGAQVIERSDPSRRGKGYALDFGCRWLERDPPEVVVVLDADCTLAPGSLHALASVCRESGRPAQALYLMHAPPGAPLGLRIAAFAWIVKNQVRPLGADALGWPCQLMGTGMAFPWPLLRVALLATSHLVEDMQLGLDLATRGAAPLFCARASLSSTFPLGRESVVSQRTRWEHGHLSLIAGAAPRLLVRAIAAGNGRLLAMVLDLIVPPLAALVTSTAVLIVLDAIAWRFAAASALPLAVASAAMALVACAVISAWARYGRGAVSWRELLAIPLYVAAKLPVYARLFTRRQVEWIRTKRDGQGR
ncbi:MAG TPA: glycosyltransferase family 2 protein [Caldimonas sp.]|nr:glycosyltransferase family 2 protein [Caldimonas sp.]